MTHLDVETSIVGDSAYIEMRPMPDEQCWVELHNLGLAGIRSFIEVSDNRGESLLLEFGHPRQQKLDVDARSIVDTMRRAGIEASLNKSPQDTPATLSNSGRRFGLLARIIQ